VTIVECPRCGIFLPEDEFEIDIRQPDIYADVSVVSVGYRCPRCTTVFGHEELTG